MEKTTKEEGLVLNENEFQVETVKEVVQTELKTENPQNKQASQQIEKAFSKKVFLNALKLAGKVAFAVVFALFYLLSTMFFISPKFDAKIFKFFGAKKAEEACYVRIYDKSQSKADLYNLILFESELENYEKELYYLNILMNDEKYEEFCLKLDEAGIEALEDVSTMVYTCNTNSYLINQKVKCMYNLGFDKGLSITVKNYLKAQLEGDYQFETSFLTYVELVYNDASLTKQEKADKVNAVHSALNSLIQQRLVFLGGFNSAVDITVKDQIISQHTIVSIKKARYIIDLINESGNAGASKLDYEKALKTYNTMLDDLIEE